MDYTSEGDKQLNIWSHKQSSKYHEETRDAMVLFIGDLHKPNCARHNSDSFTFLSLLSCESTQKYTSSIIDVELANTEMKY